MSWLHFLRGVISFGVWASMISTFLCQANVIAMCNHREVEKLDPECLVNMQTILARAVVAVSKTNQMIANESWRGLHK